MGLGSGGWDEEGRYKATWKREFKLPWCGQPTKIISMMKWIRSRRLSIKSALSGGSGSRFTVSDFGFEEHVDGVLSQIPTQRVGVTPLVPQPENSEPQDSGVLCPVHAEG